MVCTVDHVIGVVFAAHRDRYISGSGPFSLLRVSGSWLMYHARFHNTAGMFDGVLIQDGWVLPGNLVVIFYNVFQCTNVRIKVFYCSSVFLHL